MAGETLNQQTEDTSPSVDDFLAEWDNGSSTFKKVTIAKVLALLISGGSSFAWSAWVISWTNLTVGNGVVTSTAVRIGNVEFFKLELDWGTTTSVSGSVVFSTPVTSVALMNTGPVIGNWRGVGASTWLGSIVQNNTTQGIMRCFQVSGSNIREQNLAANTPETWGASSFFYGQGYYEPA